MGGVNHERLLQDDRLVWNDNFLIGWRMTERVQDVGGFGSNHGGQRYALVTFMEHHQLEWVKNSPFYW